jgi:hypothetical protein
MAEALLARRLLLLDGLFALHQAEDGLHIRLVEARARPHDEKVRNVIWFDKSALKGR